MGFCTPCAGTRPGAADPMRSRAAYPPPHVPVNLFVFHVGVLEAWTGREARLDVLEAALGVLEAGLSVLEAGPGVLEARPGVLEAGLGVLEARLSVLEA